jgi:hypothetical protein
MQLCFGEITKLHHGVTTHDPTELFVWSINVGRITPKPSIRVTRNHRSLDGHTLLMLNL